MTKILKGIIYLYVTVLKKKIRKNCKQLVKEIDFKHLCFVGQRSSTAIIVEIDDAWIITSGTVSYYV